MTRVKPRPASCTPGSAAASPTGATRRRRQRLLGERAPAKTIQCRFASPASRHGCSAASLAGRRPRSTLAAARTVRPSWPGVPGRSGCSAPSRREGKIMGWCIGPVAGLRHVALYGSARLVRRARASFTATCRCHPDCGDAQIRPPVAAPGVNTWGERVTGHGCCSQRHSGRHRRRRHRESVRRVAVRHPRMSAGSPR